MSDKQLFRELTQEEVDAVVGAGQSVDVPIDQHTPGPWRAQKDNDYGWIVIGGPTDDEGVPRLSLLGLLEADAALIASAPDLAAENRNLTSEIKWWRTVVTSKDSDIAELEDEVKRLREVLERFDAAMQMDVGRAHEDALCEVHDVARAALKGDE